MTALTATASPTALVPGDPDEIAWLAREYGRYAAGACDAARALRRIDTGSWVGPAGDAFRSAIGEVPAKLERGQAAFARASSTLTDYARVLRDAQSDAAAAVRRFDDGDPDEQVAAQHVVSAAQERVHAAARRAAQALADAEHGAPHEPGLLSRAVHAVGSFVRGAGEATWGLVELGFKTSPTYALIDPQGFLDNAESMSKGLVYGVEHPTELGKALIDYDTWRTDPARALGHLVPDLVIAFATAGAGEAGVAAGRAAEGAEVTGELAGRGAGAAAREAGLSEEVATALEERFGSPTGGALQFQGKDLYTGRDPWVDKIRMPGETLSLGAPGEGRFAAASESVEAVGTDARAYYEGLQVGPRDMGDGVARYRSHLRTYEVQRPLPVAESITQANPQFGDGGLRQYFLPDELEALIAEGYLRHVGTTEMTNLEAVIPETGLALPAAATHGVPPMMAVAAEHSTRELATTGGCR